MLNSESDRAELHTLKTLVIDLARILLEQDLSSLSDIRIGAADKVYDPTFRQPFFHAPLATAQPWRAGG
jgi:hypothetical protein